MADRKRLLVLFIATLCTVAPASAAAPSGRARTAVHAVKEELRTYGRDFRSMSTAPLHWDRVTWTHFGEGAALVAGLYAVDRPLYDAVQRNRSSFSNDFSKVFTPFGARRAENISLLMIVAGSLRDDDRMRDAGRDSLESEIWAGGVVTPLLKGAFGRARPVQGEGAESFHPFSKDFASFPSGHSTNAWAFATAIAAHYDRWPVPALVYTLATGVSLSRVNDRAHFFSDVVAGALIGRTVARGVVHRHAGHDVAWSVTPSMAGGSPMLMVHLRSR